MKPPGRRFRRPLSWPDAICLKVEHTRSRSKRLLYEIEATNGGYKIRLSQKPLKTHIPELHAIFDGRRWLGELMKIHLLRAQHAIEDLDGMNEE